MNHCRFCYNQVTDDLIRQNVDGSWFYRCQDKFVCTKNRKEYLKNKKDESIAEPQ